MGYLRYTEVLVRIILAEVTFKEGVKIRSLGLDHFQQVVVRIRLEVVRNEMVKVLLGLVRVTSCGYGLDVEGRGQGHLGLGHPGEGQD